MKASELESRLIDFTCNCIGLAESLSKNFAGMYFASQLIRSSSSPALHYSEAQAAESRKDFIHKMKICLKELRETYSCLRIINKKNWLPGESIEQLIDENNQLIAIFVSSIKTAVSKNTSKSL